MANIVVLGEAPRCHFVPSNLRVAIGWRERPDIEVDLAEVMARKNFGCLPQGAERVHPEENRIALKDGSSLTYDYLVIATGPDLAFDEIPGLGASGYTRPTCHVDHAVTAREAFEAF